MIGVTARGPFQKRLFEVALVSKNDVGVMVCLGVKRKLTKVMMNSHRLLHIA